MKTLTLFFLVTFPLSVITMTGQSVEHSQLWGKEGEHWTPQGRLPDWSWAGYRHGERPLPDPKSLDSEISVKDFGAVGDGRKDDSEAFERALREIRRYQK